nr:hypothetical protein [Tanacetum cinerariifolium]
MDHQYPTVAKIHVLDTEKFEQWQFRIQQYLQHEHYALWEVIEFGDSYKVPTNTDPDNATTRKDDEQSGRTVTITTEDMQRKKNDFMDVEVEKDDLNQKFLTSLAPEWRMHTIVWRNRNDLDTMSLDYLYNHLKVYEAKVQKKSNSNSQDMAFISSSKNSSNEDGNTVYVTTASIAFPTGSVNVATISQDTASAYIASQSNGSQIKFEDINQIDEDDMEETDIKWSMTLLSMRADRFWKRTGKKISIKGSDVAGFDKSKVECFNCHKMGHFTRECRAPRKATTTTSIAGGPSPSVDVSYTAFKGGGIKIEGGKDKRRKPKATTTTSIAGGPSPLVVEDPTTTTQVPPVTPDHAAVSAHADTEVHTDTSCPDDTQTASEQVLAEHTVDVSTTVAFTSRVSHATPSSSCRHRKQIAKKRITPIVEKSILLFSCSIRSFEKQQDPNITSRNSITTRRNQSNRMND